MLLWSLLLTGLYASVKLSQADSDVRTFFRKLCSFRRALISDIPTFNPAVEAEEVLATWKPSNRITWNPVSCGQLGIVFFEEELVFGKLRSKEPSNLVYRVSDAQGKKYAYKVYGNSHDYVGETAFYMQAGHHEHLLKPVCVQRPEDGGRKRAYGGLLVEWFDGIDALAYAERSNVTEFDLTQLSKKVLETLAYIHALGFVHADMKPGNVLISPSTNHMKVIDFGFAAPVNQIKMFRGNPRILAPEVAGIGGGRVGFGADWWAYGSFVASIHAAKHPEMLDSRGKYAPLAIDRNGIDYNFGVFPAKLNPAVRQLIFLCMHPNPAMRGFTKPLNLALFRSLPYFTTSYKVHRTLRLPLQQSPGYMSISNSR